MKEARRRDFFSKAEKRKSPSTSRSRQHVENERVYDVEVFKLCINRISIGLVYCPRRTKSATGSFPSVEHSEV
jgi:hypothetical protein